MNIKAFAVIFAFLANVASAQTDIAGGADHPDVPRISGSVLVAYDAADFAEGEFLALDADEKLERRYVEGQATRLVYATPEGTTTLSAFRNYEEAFAGLGKITEIYSCRRDCNKEMGRRVIWSKEARFETNLADLKQIYSSHLYHGKQIYWFAKVESDTAVYHVSFYATARKDYQLRKTELKEGRVLVHIQIIGDDSFESDLEFVEASKIESAIADDGHIALYGLFFDTGKDTLTADSAPTLAEIAKVLDGSPDLNVYVVGHTDSVGSVANNLDLSERRAASVVRSLTQEYGIVADRLIPLGAGLAAPVSTNQTDEGRALNRRVELVQR